MRYKLLEVRVSSVFNIGYYVAVGLFDLPRNDDWLIENEVLKLTGSKEIRRMDVSNYYREYTTIEGNRYAVELVFDNNM